MTSYSNKDIVYLDYKKSDLATNTISSSINSMSILNIIKNKTLIVDNTFFIASPIIENLTK